MISTQPEVSAVGVLVLSSAITLLGRTVLFLSGDAARDWCEDLELDAVGDVVPEGPALGEATAPCWGWPFARAPFVFEPVILCSSTLTRARISDTICTPLLRVGAARPEGTGLDALRPKRGAAIGVRPARRLVGMVEERVSGEGMPEGDDPRAERGWNPARRRIFEWPGAVLVAGSAARGAVATTGGASFAGTPAASRSDSCSSCDTRLDM